VIVGAGALHPGTADEVRSLARALNAPVATTPKAKGVFAEDHPLFAGTLEMAGDGIIIEFLRQADALVLVGVDAVEFDKPWRLSSPTVHVDTQPNRDAYYAADVEIVGDIGKALHALAAEPRPSAWRLEELVTHRGSLRAYTRRDGSGLHPRDVVDEVHAAMSRDAIATSDVGAHKLLVGQAWPAYEPLTFFMANGLSSMGYSIPVAAAARLVHPKRQIVAFIGDGGLGMYLGELETLVRAQIDLLIVTFVDGSLELIRRAQMGRGVPTDGVSFANPDYAALGRAFGVHAVEMSTRRELRRLLPDLISSHGVRLAAVHIDGDSYRL
jgi:acetolactate synthase-1/2/3 large subunit